MLQLITLISMLLLIALDQIIKILVVKQLKPVGSVPLIDGFIQLRYTENTGAAFGSFSEYTNILSAVTFVVIVAGILYLMIGKKKINVEYVCVVLMISGGAGNLIDRVFRGYVVDYIEPLFIDFAIFNFADVLVTCSAVVLVIYMLYDIFREQKRVKNERVNN